jgi:hypothetical protein
MAVNRYYRLLIGDFARLNDAACHVLPTNRAAVNRFIDSDAVYYIDALLSGMEDKEEYDHFDWTYDKTFGRFKEYIFQRELSMQRILAKLRYDIDQENTLTLVAGNGRPETVSNSLLCLFHNSSPLPVFPSIMSSVLEPRGQCCLLGQG